ncbi:MAG: FAD-dependent oxidoreductase [Acidobacteria bacterium]|nr:FAD-dependent oxidoreductase [Acidobacteriota bacterium]
MRVQTSLRHVLVAGAGLAGLAAARVLNGRGVRTTVIDARDRVGGRVWTIREGFAGGQHAEGGADLIESDQAAVLALARELRLPLVPILKRGFGFYGTGTGGRRTMQNGMRRLGALFAPFAEAVQQYKLTEGRSQSPIVQALARESVAEYLTRTGATPATIERMRSLRGFFLADPEDLSTLALVEFLATDGFGGDGGMFRIKGGNDQLATSMAAQLTDPVVRGTVLRKVTTTARGIRATVESARGRQEIVADALVIAMPATAVRDVVFAPGLPDAQWTAMLSLKYGGATRVLLQHASRYWVRAGRPRAFGSDLSTGAVWDGNEQQPGRAGILSLLAGGRASHELVAILNHEGAEGVVVRLRWLGKPSALLASHVVRWNDDPWVRGGYAFFDPDFAPEGRDLLARPAGRIVFAGEHTSIRWQGYMNGAIESGYRAAEELRSYGMTE